MNIESRMNKWNLFVEFVSGYLARRPTRLSDRLERKPKAKRGKNDGNHRSRLRSYPGGPTMSRHEENLIREGIIVR